MAQAPLSQKLTRRHQVSTRKTGSPPPEASGLVKLTWSTTNTSLAATILFNTGELQIGSHFVFYCEFLEGKGRGGRSKVIYTLCKIKYVFSHDDFPNSGSHFSNLQLSNLISTDLGSYSILKLRSFLFLEIVIRFCAQDIISVVQTSGNTYYTSICQMILKLFLCC